MTNNIWQWIKNGISIIWFIIFQLWRWKLINLGGIRGVWEIGGNLGKKRNWKIKEKDVIVIIRFGKIVCEFWTPKTQNPDNYQHKLIFRAINQKLQWTTSTSALQSLRQSWTRSLRDCSSQPFSLTCSDTQLKKSAVLSSQSIKKEELYKKSACCTGPTWRSVSWSNAISWREVNVNWADRTISGCTHTWDTTNRWTLLTRSVIRTNSQSLTESSDTRNWRRSTGFEIVNLWFKTWSSIGSWSPLLPQLVAKFVWCF